MLIKILQNSAVQTAVILVMVVGVGMCVLPEHLPERLRFIEQFVPQIMMGYLFAGLLFLILRQPRLLFASFGCCAALAIYLKPTENISEENNAVKIKIAHFSLSDAGDDAEFALSKILETNADLISVQEVTPDWQFILEEKLDTLYPYFHTVMDLSMHSVSVFSKHEFNFIDTFNYKDIPNLTGMISIGEDYKESVQFVCAYPQPAFNQTDYDEVREHLNLIQERLKNFRNPHFVIGNFYMVPWSKEVQAFRRDTGLEDSRTYHPTGALSFFDIPLDHIFHSKNLKCNSFDNVDGKNSTHLGIQGTYELKYVE